MRFDIKGYREPEGVLVASFEAASIEEARLLAGEQGIRVLSVSKNWRDSFTFFQRSHFDLQLFSQELHALLDAGLSLIESLTALAGKESAPQKRALLDHLMQRLREGRPLSAVLQDRPDIFPPLYISLVGASERTGDLKSALSRYIAYRGQMDAVKKKVVSASIYPALLILVGGLVVLFLMGYVVPRFSRIYGDFGRDIPLMSRLLIQWGALVEAYGLQVFAVLVAVLGGLWTLSRRHVDRQRLMEGLLASKVLRERFHSYELARFYRTLGMLQQGGIPIVTALTMASGLLGQRGGEALGGTMRDVRAGTPLSEALQRHGLAPAVAYDLLRVGEKAGDIGEKMIRIADFLDEDLSRWLDWFSRLFEPLLMLGIGLFIAFVVVLLYLPVFELAGNIQ
ncbi:MAG: type II secretion system F family protein [Rhodocyclaceae bacterium]|nr:type II secretion system F family protein [Rhodocyclaceae bacterium]